MNLIVRPLKANDFEQWKPLYKEYWGDGATDNLMTEVFSGLLAQENNCAAYIAINDGLAIGFAHIVYHYSVSDRGKAAFLEDLSVTARYRRQGIAKQIIDFSIQEAKKNGCIRFHWLTNPDNQTARGLYEKYASGQHWLRYAIREKS